MKKLLLNIFAFAICLNALAQIPTNGLMGYYNFNNSNTRDTSNNERHTYGGFSFGTDRNGNANSAYSGGRCGIQMPTPNGGGLTISCWVKFSNFANTNTSYPMIASTGVYIFDNNNNQLGFIAKYLMYGQEATNDSFIPRLDLYTGANGLNAIGVGVDCGKKIKAGEWHHITATHNNADTSVKWYVDGKFINKEKLLGPIYLYTGMTRTEDDYDVIGDLIIGGSSRGIFNGVNRLVQGSIYAHHSFDGSIDEFLIYDRGFSHQECVNLYNHFTGNVGIAPTISFNAIKAYPNPSNGIIMIEGMDVKNKKIELMNVEGKTLNIIVNENTIDISSLEKGIYFITIKSENGVIEAVEKIIKN